ncbi:MAG: LL-diaminopimelate aminotransferase, partial [Candidatus Omnitrophica bacterium]|nr:LL-diaminopimelate aminotransferase [Candidatus Omnitrophota bacterium]
FSHRLQNLPPYLFAELDCLKEEAVKQGRDVIDLGVGDPDLSTPQPAVEELCREASKNRNQHYPSNRGLLEFRQAIAEWYEKRFNVSLNPQTEILPLIGSKEGIAHIPAAFINPGDLALVPDPAYPAYRSGIILAGGIPYSLPLLKENSFLPALNKIKKGIVQKAKLLFLNYPNNPTAAIAPPEFLQEAVEFAQKHNIVLCYDNAYSEIAFGGYRPKSILEMKGAKDVAVEFHSLSKTYNMTGWRIGWVCGQAKIIAALAKLKSNIDSGIFLAIQKAGVSALNLENKKTMKIYERRKNILAQGLRKLGWDVESPRATFYFWLCLPLGFKSSLEFSRMLLKEKNVIVTPGVGFGRYGEGYFRIALTVSEQRIEEAINRLQVTSHKLQGPQSQVTSKESKLHKPN